MDRHGNGIVAIRFLADGEFSGTSKEVEMAGLLTVADGKLTELRIVTDLRALNDTRIAIGLPALE